MYRVTTLIVFGLIAAPVSAADPAHPAVVELYQSQGCSSGPPADLGLNALADRLDVLALNFAVTYWDRLGREHTFASPAFTKRRWDYAHAGRRDSVGTPQLIVNGPAIASDGRAATIIADEGQGTLWLLRYDPRTIAVPIRAGENGGRTVPHRNIVPPGAWTANQARFSLPAANSELASALILQAGTGGPIVAGRKI